MALKKSQIYASLWQSCDELRGGMDSSQYKDYILTLLFMKYVSDKYADNPYALVDIPDGGGFDDMVKLRGDIEIGDKINKIIAKFAESNELKGVVDQADFNDASKLGAGKEMQDRLSKLVAIFDALDFRANRAEGDDLLGDAYEYLMRHFATESGKSKGQFYTPAEVSRIMAKVIGIGPDTRQDHTIYDPTCGSGSLLLKAADEAPNEISIYGQEKDKRHLRARPDEHVSARQSDRRHLARQHTGCTEFQESTQRLKDLRFRRRQSAPSPTKPGTPASILRTTSFDASSTGFRPPKTAITPFCSTSSHRSTAGAKALLFSLTACCFAAIERRISAERLSSMASSRESSVCLPISSTAPASPLAFWSSTRRMPTRVAASS